METRGNNGLEELADLEVRIGWSTERGDVQAPVGFDKFGYSYRDKEGTVFHQSKGRQFGGASYGTHSWSKVNFFKGPKDILGFHITLPLKQPKSEEQTVGETPNANLAPIVPKKDEEESQILKGSKIVIYKNGVCQGTAFEGLFEGIQLAVDLFDQTQALTTQQPLCTWAGK
jgi:Set1/Ash2 histone methyltransferase complex subunit ASH2